MAPDILKVLNFFTVHIFFIGKKENRSALDGENYLYERQRFLALFPLALIFSDYASDPGEGRWEETYDEENYYQPMLRIFRHLAPKEFDTEHEVMVITCKLVSSWKKQNR